MRAHQSIPGLVRMCLIGSLLVIVGSTKPVMANTFTYLYTGFPFSVWFNSGCPPECSLTGSMTFAQPLPSNLPWTTPLLSVDTLLAYSFTDGLNSYTQSNSTFKELYGSTPCDSIPCVATGPGGAITYWSIALLNSAGLQLLSQGYPAQNGEAGYDSIIINSQYGTNIQAGSSFYGAWTGPIVNTPEPPSLFPLVMVLLAAAKRVKGRGIKAMSRMVLATVRRGNPGFRFLGHGFLLNCPV